MKCNQNVFNIFNIKLCTEIEGPYKRCCIWFQGCNIKCKGCCNFELQELKAKHLITLDNLLSIIKEAKSKYGIEGVTLSGGEPTLQKDLSLLCEEIHKLNLGVILFSGYYRENIKDDIVKNVDVLIDGPFDIDRIDNDRILIGSTNKRLEFITNRYIDQKEYFYSPIAKEEICLDDYIFINGD